MSGTITSALIGIDNCFPPLISITKSLFKIDGYPVSISNFISILSSPKILPDDGEMFNPYKSDTTLKTAGVFAKFFNDVVNFASWPMEIIPKSTIFEPNLQFTSFTIPVHFKIVGCPSNMSQYKFSCSCFPLQVGY